MPNNNIQIIEQCLKILSKLIIKIFFLRYHQPLRVVIKLHNNFHHSELPRPFACDNK